MTNPFHSASTFAKTADIAPGADPWAGFYNGLADHARSDIGRFGLTGLGVGAAGAGIYGLMNLAKRKLNPHKPSYPGALVTPVPYPVAADGDDTPDKTAAEKEASSPQYTDYHNIPWYYPAAFAATGLGMAGGWAGVDHLLNSRRKSDSDTEMHDAKSDFESALLDSYSKPRAAMKTAGDKLGELLDQLYDGLAAGEKTAEWYNPLSYLSDDHAGALGGMYGTYALGTGAAAALMAYNRSNKSSDRSVLDKAMKLRMRHAYLSRPSEIMAVPHPVTVGGGDATPMAAKDPDELASADAEGPEEAVDETVRPKRKVDFLGKVAAFAK